MTRFGMRPGGHPSGRRTAALAVIASAMAMIAAGAALFSAASLGRIAAWCEDLLLMRPADAGSAALAAFAALLVAAALAAVTVALAKEFVAARALRVGIKRNAVRLPGRVAAALAAIGADAMPTVVVADSRRFAYTFGAIGPRVVLSTGLVSALSLEEMKAVLLHERRHLLARDPLRSLFWETACRAFFFLPLLRDVADHLALARELDADHDAVRGSPGKRTLASALLKAASYGPGPVGSAWAAFGHLRGRIDALSGAKSGASLRLGAARTAVSAAAFTAILCAAAAPVRAETSTAAMHCRTAIERKVDVVLYSPYLLGRPVGPSSTETDLQSREIVP